MTDQAKPPEDSRFERALFTSRWLLAPFFVGLVLAIALLLVRFSIELWTLAAATGSITTHDAVISLLTLIDIALVACLALIIAFSGYEIFISRLHSEDHPDRPHWLGTTGFTDLKAKLLGALVAIAAIELLKGLFNLEHYSQAELAWKTGAMLAFAVTAALFGYSDRVAARDH
jgi:uncharacterized protein (TIGR00645 family)